MNGEMAAWGAPQALSIADLCIEAAKRKFIRGGIRRFLLNRLAGSDDYRDIVVDGFKVRAHYADNDTERDLCIVGAAKHAAEIDMLMGYLEPGDTFIDVGANCGWFTLNASRRVGPFGRVIAIEPLPEMLGRLCFNVRANELKNVIPIHAALAPESGTMTLHVNRKQRGMSGAHPECGGTPIYVPTLPLAEILSTEARPRCHLLKIDVEGYEDRVLLPMLWDMSRWFWPRKIFMETRHSSRWLSPCVDTLCQHGYSVIWQDKGDALLSL